MGFPKLNTLIFIAAGILAMASCKKDEESETTPGLNGALAFNVEAYVLPGTEVTVTPTGLMHPKKDKNIGFYWRVSPDSNMKTADTTRYENGLNKQGEESDGSFSYKFKDSTATYGVSCVAFAKGYSSSYKTRYVTVVRPGMVSENEEEPCTITGTGILAGDPTIPNQEIEYYYTEVNGLDWMRNNLADPASGVPYDNCEAMSNVLGRYYSYNEAVTACPEGWRLPTREEWKALAASVEVKSDNKDEAVTEAAGLMADAKFNLNEMWEYWPEVGNIKNTKGISIIPAGFANLGSKKDGKYPQAVFYRAYEYATFWTKDAKGADMAYYVYLIDDQPKLFEGFGDKETFGASVRCVKETTSNQ